MDEKPKLPTQEKPPKRKRGRPRKQRTEPPKVDQAKADPKPKPKPDQKPNASTDQPGRFVTIRLPIGELTDGDEYQTSKNNLPRQIRTRPLTREQAKAVAAVRLGMLAEGSALETGRQDFYTGGRRAVKVETKEQVISKILELIAEAIEENV